MKSQWKIMLAIAAVLPTICCTKAMGRSELYYTDSSSIYRLRDINGDGDALDPGENVLWSDLVNTPTRLTSLSGGILTNDSASGGGLTMLRDLNGDGDALDAGEATPWFFDPKASYFSEFRSSGSTVYAVNGFDIDGFTVGAEVYRLLDLNGDGDAQDTNEFSLFADGFTRAFSLDVRGNNLRVGDVDTGEVYAVQDKNSDGDALDVGERLLHGTPGLTFGSKIHIDSANSYFVSNPSAPTIERATDRNGDGDALDIAEIVTFADPRPDGIVLQGPMALAGHLFALGAQNGNYGVYQVLDLNGDGDALDVAEVVRYADTPFLWDMVAVSCGPGDFDCDDDVDGRDFLVWQRGGSPSPLSSTDLADWRANYGSTSFTATSIAVPEPSALGAMLLGGLCLMWARLHPPARL